MMTSHTSLYQSNYVDVGNAEHIVAVLKLLRGTSEDPHPGPTEKKKSPVWVKLVCLINETMPQQDCPLLFFLAAVDALKQGVDPNCNW